MSDVGFHQTRMGQQFYDKTMPALVRQLERIADRLPTTAPERAAEIDDLLLATEDLVSAVERALEAETAPSSEAKKQALRSLRSRANVAERAANAMRRH